MLYFSIKKACVSLIFLCNLQYKPERTDIYHYVASFLSSSYPYDLYISISTNKKMIRPSETIQNTLICCYSSSSSKTKNCFNTRLWFSFPFPVLRSLSSTFVFRRYLFAYYFYFLGCYEISFWWYYVVLLIVQNVIQPYQKKTQK